MEPKETLKITINGQVYLNLDDVPEKYRELVRAQMKLAAEKVAGQPGANVTVKKTIQMSGSIGPTSLEDPSRPLQPSGLRFLQSVIPWVMLAFLAYMILRNWR